MPNYQEEGKLASQVKIKKGHRQLDVSIPEHLVELFDIKVGDRFNWYVRRKEDKMSLTGVYVKYVGKKFIKRKEEKRIGYP